MVTPKLSEPARLAGVATRFLRDDERPYPTEEVTVPLVVQATLRRDAEFLSDVVSDCSTQIRAALDQYGAVLFRGFAVHSDDEFANAVSGIRGLCPMTGYFMAENGRSPTKGSTNVFHTNTRFKTGGGFGPPSVGFHSENYYTMDTPAFQSFWCKRNPWLGGETALVHMPRAYQELSAETRSKLEGPPVCAPTVFPVSHVAHVYGLPEQFVRAFFEELGFPIVAEGEQSYIVVQKPIVFRHPSTGQATLSANLSAELPGLHPALAPMIAPHYAGWKWALHRLVWRHPDLLRFANELDNLSTQMRFHPRQALQELLETVRHRPRPEGPWRRMHQEANRKHSVHLDQKLNAEEVQALARGVWKHCSVISWCRGDILVWDNLQMLHSGMPGFGPRELHVMLCNPLFVRRPVGTGPSNVVVEDSARALDTQLRQARAAQPAGDFHLGAQAAQRTQLRSSGDGARREPLHGETVA